VDQRQQLFCFLIGNDEFDLYRKLAGEFKEPRLMQRVVPAESADGLESRTTANAKFVRLLQQPFPNKMMMMPVSLVHEKPQE
jgi:hypothetical protein